MNIVEIEKMRLTLKSPNQIYTIEQDSEITNIRDVMCFLIVKDEKAPMDKKIVKMSERDGLDLIARRQKLLETELDSTFNSSGYMLVPVFKTPGKVYYLDKKFKSVLLDERILYVSSPEMAKDCFNSMFSGTQYSAKAFFILNRVPYDAEEIRQLLKSYDIFMNARVAFGNRILINFKNKLGDPAYRELRDKYIFQCKADWEKICLEKLKDDEEVEHKEYDEEEALKAVKQNLRISFNKIVDSILQIMKTKGFAGNPDLKDITKRHFKLYAEINPDKMGLFSHVSELAQMQLCEIMKDSENKTKRMLEEAVKEHPLYKSYLGHVAGCGPILAARLITGFNIYVAVHCSSFERYVGLDCVNGKARPSKAVEKETYIDGKGELKTKDSLGYNPGLKSALLGVLASEFFKQKNTKYVKIYNDVKKRYENRPDLVEKEKKKQCSIAKMARRYMIKQFLHDLWEHWRTLEGLPLNGGTYEEGVLGMHHHDDDTEVVA